MRNFSINSDIAHDYIKQVNIGVYSDLLILIGTSASFWHYTRPRCVICIRANKHKCICAMTLALFVIHHLSTITAPAQRRPARHGAAPDHSRFRRQSMMLLTEC